VRRVLVTGASGCVGRPTVAFLAARGWDVHALTSRATPPELPGVALEHAAGAVRWHQVDLLQPGAAAAIVREVQPTHLLHLAWYIAPGRWAAAPNNFQWVQASLDLCHAFVEQGGQRFVGAGSCLEYDWSAGFCSEARTPFAPHTFYGACKHALERLIDGYSRSRDFSFAWSRIFFLYGPWEHPDRLLASVIRSVLAGVEARCSHGEQIRDYLFVDDVARAFVELVEGDARGAYNVASGQPVRLKELALRAGELAGRPDLVRLGVIPAAATDVPLVLADMTRTFGALAWRPQVSVDEGLARTIAWWREHRTPGALVSA